MDTLNSIFCPNSIAVVGASADMKKRSSRPLIFLRKHGFTGNIYPVNPKYNEVGGLKCYKSIKEIPCDVHTVMISVPKRFIFNILNDCEQKKVKLAIIRSAGFAEAGEEGRKLQERMKLQAIRGNFRILGPSSLGFANIHRSVVPYFHLAGFMPNFIPGKVGLISQSGGLSGAIFNMIQDQGVGVSYVFSTGSEADIDAVDCLEFLLNDSNTSIIAAFIEGFNRPKKFVELAIAASHQKKPIILMKIGRSERGQKAARTHTGALTGSDSVYSALFKQHGVVRVEDLSELIYTVSVFSKCPPPEGNGVGIITSSGGTKAILADISSEVEMSVPDLGQDTKDKISKIVPEHGAVTNPLDITGGLDETTFSNCMKIFSNDERLHGIIVPITLLGDATKERAFNLINLAKNIKKPVVCLWIGGSLNKEGHKILEKSPIPLIKDAKNCIFAMKALLEYYDFTRNLHISDRTYVTPPKKLSSLETFDEDTRILNEYESKKLLSDYGFPSTRERLAHSLDEALSFAKEISFPLVLKVISRQIPHKTDAGVVKVGIGSRKEIESYWKVLTENAKKFDPRAQIEGVLLQEMVEDAVEVILGVSKDDQVGPLIVFGLGGIFVELMSDISMRVPPLTRRDAETMVQEIKGSNILKGFRGRPEADLDSLIEMILKLSQFALDHERRIFEVEINPLAVLSKGKGVKIVDSLIVLNKDGMK